MHSTASIRRSSLTMVRMTSTRLLGDAGIVRNRLKVAAAISNAQAFLETAMRSAHSMPTSGGLRRPRAGRGQGRWGHPGDDAESDAMSKDLKRRGFRFVAAPSAMPSCRAPVSLTTTSKAASEPRHPEKPEPLADARGIASPAAGRSSSSSASSSTSWCSW